MSKLKVFLWLTVKWNIMYDIQNKKALSIIKVCQEHKV